MKFASFQIQIGAIVGLPLTQKQSVFHSSLIEILNGEKSDLVTSQGIPISQSEAVHSPGVLKKRIVDFLKKTTPSGSSSFSCILDLCSTPYFIIRDPLLLEMINGISESIEIGICSDFIILLPEMPGEDGAFRYSIKNLNERHPDKIFEIRIISNDGTQISYKSQNNNSDSKITNYLNIREATYDDVQSRIEKKCVKRLGHFTGNSATDAKLRCRHFSYFLYNCDNEMQISFKKWWETIGFSAKAILYDLKNNQQMREVVLAHAGRLDIKAERIFDVISDDSLSSKIKEISPVVLVLDAIESGITLQRYIDDLASLGINTIGNVFVTVNKHGERLSEPKLKIHGLIKRPGEPSDKLCEQCRLQLPKTNEATESFMRIRSYDMHYMIGKCGWESEPLTEVPGNQNSQFKTIPNFTLMLKEYGDWIGYKLYSAIINRGVHESWFIIHPAEADSSSLAQRLYDCAEHELSIISIPKDKIEAAKANGKSWHKILSENSKDHWVDQLNSMRSANASAVILDIFNGSGETCKSLIKLLKDCNLQSLIYCCLVDFNPNKENQAIDDVQKIALYEWHHPRLPQVVK